MSKKWQSLIIIFATIAISILAFKLNIFSQLSDQFTDKLFLRHAPDSHIVVIAIDDESLKQIGAWPWPREIFAEALLNVEGAKAIGLDINFSEPSRLGASDDTKLAETLSILSEKVILPIELDKNDQLATLPLALFSEKTEQGFVNVPLSPDGTGRDATISRGNYKSFDYLIASHKNPITEGPNVFRIAYNGGSGTYLTFPFSDLLDGRIPQDVFKDNTVLIGATAPDLHDILQTPFGPLSGVEVHANIIQTLKNGRYFSNIPDWLTYLIFVLISIGIFYSVRKLRSLSVLSIVFLISLAVLYALSAYFFTLYIIIPAIYFLFNLVLSLIVAVAFEYLTESKEKRFIRKAFQHYLSPELIDELLKNPKKLILGGERRHVSILFTDIRSFTSISESMSPEDLTMFMSEYFTVVSEIILEKKGILDKYIGDAIMAFWGAPITNRNHAAHACQVAISMFEQLAKQNKLWVERGLSPVKIGVGINTGDVIVGNMGSARRFNYGILGDEVNLASRLEGLTKYYGVGCIVSESTSKEAEETKDLFFRPLDQVLVKGKKDPRRLYELLIVPLSKDLEKHYLEGLDFYEKGEWKKAMDSFKVALVIDEDGPSKVFLERSKNFLENPPENWKGVFEFKVK